LDKHVALLREDEKKKLKSLQRMFVNSFLLPVVDVADKLHAFTSTCRVLSKNRQLSVFWKIPALLSNRYTLLYVGAVAL
jgi:hypothetical protein